RGNDGNSRKSLDMMPARLDTHRSADMPPTTTFDLIVIGAGPGGVAAADTAALLGKRVALVEKQPAVGGAAVNTGTIPSKTLRETALAIAGVKARALFGVDVFVRREAKVEDFLRHERLVTASEAHQMRTCSTGTGSRCFRAQASSSTRTPPEWL